MYFADSLQDLAVAKKLTADIEWEDEKTNWPLMMEFRSGDGWNGLIYFIFKSYFVINLGQKKGKKKKKRKKHLHVQQESPFTLKNRTVRTRLILCHDFRDSSFYSGGLRKVLAQKQVCVCVLNKYALSFHMILFQGPG